MGVLRRDQHHRCVGGLRARPGWLVLHPERDLHRRSWQVRREREHEQARGLLLPDHALHRHGRLGDLPPRVLHGYLMGGVSQDSLNLVYNLADMVNKIAFCLAIWAAAKADTAEKAALMRQFS